MYTRERKIEVLSIFAGLLILFSVGCKKLEELQLGSKTKVLQPQGTVIAKVDDLPITLEQLDQEIESYNQLIDNPAARVTTREQKLSFLNEELIRRYLFYLHATALGLDQRPKVRELLRNLEINVLANQFMQDEVGNITVTSSEIEDFYNIYKEQYQQAEERKIREIVLDTEAEAKDVLIQLLQGADFAGIATQRSRAESAGKGGDLGFIKKGQRGADFAAFDEVAFSRSLNTNQISNIFKVKERYYIIEAEAIKGGQAKPLSEVWDDINKNVLFLKQQQKLQEITARLAKKNKIVMYEDKIK